MNREQKPLLVRSVHWITFLLFVIALISGYRQADTSWPGTGFPDRDTVHAAHETAGIFIVLVLVVWGIIRVRQVSKFSKLTMFKRVLILYHGFFVCLGFAIALLAWMGSSSGDYGQALFGSIPVPNITPVLGAKWAVFFNDLHKELIPYFLGMFFIHVISALFHLLVLRDKVFYSIWFGKSE